MRPIFMIVSSKRLGLSRREESLPPSIDRELQRRGGEGTGPDSITSNLESMQLVHKNGRTHGSILAQLKKNPTPSVRTACCVKNGLCERPSAYAPDVSGAKHLLEAWSVFTIFCLPEAFVSRGTGSFDSQVTKSLVWIIIRCGVSYFGSPKDYRNTDIGPACAVMCKLLNTTIRTSCAPRMYCCLARFSTSLIFHQILRPSL